jgi:hypothetical protein
MTASRLDPPQALDLVPAEQVRDIIANTDSELSELERSAEFAHDAAERAERAISEAGLDPESSAWTMVRLQRFLAGLRDEAQRDVETMLELARHQARIRSNEVGASRDVPRPVVRAAAPVVPAPAPVAPSPAPVAAPVAPPVAVSPPVEAPAAAGVTPAPGPAGPAASAAVAVPVAEPACEEPGVPLAPEPEAAPHLTLVTPAPVVPTAPAPAQPVAAAPTATQQPLPRPAATQPTPAASAPAAKPGLLRRLPISAILEVVAVLLILVFILLRLS